jgi:hypothetical protein
MTMTFWIVLFVVVDAVVLYFVLRHALRKHGFNLAGLDLKKVSRFSTQIHDETGRYLQANYSGDPAQLPRAMQGLLSVVAARAEQEGLTLSPDLLKRLVETSAIKHRIAKAGEIRSALERAA